MVAVPETAGVHWKTRSGALPELPQLPACELAPLVVPLKVPPWAGIAGGSRQAPASVGVVVEAGVADGAAENRVVGVVAIARGRPARMVVPPGGVHEVVAVAVVVVDSVEVVVVARVGWKTAHTAYQPVAVPRVAVPRWAPAALDVMSSSNEEPLEFRARCVYGTPALLPGVTVMGEPPVTKAANTSSPAPTAAVVPVSTAVP